MSLYEDGISNWPEDEAGQTVTRYRELLEDCGAAEAKQCLIQDVDDTVLIFDNELERLRYVKTVQSLLGISDYRNI